MANPVFDQVLFPAELNKNWHMSFAERAALIHVARLAAPEISIEIGTFLGGSLRPIASLSRQVFSFDIDPNQHVDTHGLTNVTYVTGDTRATLPPLIQQINDGPDELNFILIDGSHETDGVRSDIEHCLAYRPKARPTYIVMHDSGNPAVRAGIKAAPWADNPHIHALDLDFVNAMLFNRHDIYNQIWGGLALAVLMPEPRSGDLVVTSYFDHSLEAFRRMTA